MRGSRVAPAKQDSHRIRAKTINPIGRKQVDGEVAGGLLEPDVPRVLDDRSPIGVH